MLVLLLQGCAGAPPRPTPRPAPPPSDLGTIPDAVPRIEPRSTRGNPPFYEVAGRRYTVLASAAGFTERGVASWYGPDFHGKNTSSGEPYDMYAMTAAHKTLPLPCYARVTNLANGRSVIVRINDRGPFVANRVIDLSYSAAARLDIVRTGTAFVELQTIVPGESGGVISSAQAAPPSLPSSPPPAPPSTLTGSPLYIQIGAYADEANAQAVIARLQGAGVQRVYSSTVSGANGQRLRRVRIGPLSGVDEFDRLMATLTAQGFTEARLATDLQ